MILQFESQIPEFNSDSFGLIRNWLEAVAISEDRRIGEIVYKFVSEERILEVNQKFLNHDYVTDIITFDTSYLKEVSGEIYICVKEVERNAVKHSENKFQNEMHRVILHGLLHLIGYGDSSVQEQRNIRFKEDSYLKLLTIS